jgi:hypothetical protein
MDFLFSPAYTPSPVSKSLRYVSHEARSLRDGAPSRVRWRGKGNPAKFRFDPAAKVKNVEDTEVRQQ